MHEKYFYSLGVKRTASFSLLILLSVLLFGASVYASTGLTIQPVKILHTINPEASVSDTISLTNASDEDVQVEVTVEDFIPAAGSLNLQFIGRAEGVTTVRDWITVGGKDSFVFKKGESRAIPYTIKAPPNAEPGAHFGVVFFEATRLQAEGQLKVGARVGVLVFITVPGDNLQKGKILDFAGPSFVTSGPVKFTIKFENTGTVHFEPKGTIAITNIFGNTVENVPVAGQVVLPTGARDLTAEWNAGSFITGRYSAFLKIVDGDGNELTGETIEFYAFPVWNFIGFIIVVLALFFGIRFLKRKVKISFVK